MHEGVPPPLRACTFLFPCAHTFLLPLVVISLPPHISSLPPPLLAFALPLPPAFSLPPPLAPSPRLQPEPVLYQPGFEPLRLRVPQEWALESFSGVLGVRCCCTSGVDAVCVRTR